MAIGIIKNIQNKLDKVFWEIKISVHGNVTSWTFEKNILFKTINRYILIGEDKLLDGLPK